MKHEIDNKEVQSQNDDINTEITSENENSDDVINLLDVSKITIPTIEASVDEEGADDTIVPPEPPQFFKQENEAVSEEVKTEEVKSEEAKPEEKKSDSLIESAIKEENKNVNKSVEEKIQANNVLKANYMSPLFLKSLFANDNDCLTAPGGELIVKDDIRNLLALFSNGRFFVAEDHKFDGKVLSFEYLAKRRNLNLQPAEYIPTPILQSIYNYAEENQTVEEVIAATNEDNETQVRMQRDFITIVTRAANLRVSDIHIVVADYTTVMFRVNGLMQTEMEYNKEWGESFVRAAFASADISDSNYAQNEYQSAQKLGRTPLRGSNGKLLLPKSVLGIRLQFNPIAFGTRYVVMRLLYAEEDTMNETGALESLGFGQREKDFFYQLRAAPTGITVISGPTGSGKSTTLQRNMILMLQERNFEINLITVEDPTEYPIPGARQMPVTNASTEELKEREFTKALSAALRSDPDSLMIGEVRTLSAADLAFRGALSGHNVWTTLHANSAPAILMRLKDLGVEEFKLRDPEIMKGLLAQRLFRKLCPHCKISAMQALAHPSVQRLRRTFGDIGLESTYLRGKGCQHCDFRGVKGRIAVAEIILPDATFLDLLLKAETQKAMNYWINDLNGMTLREVALQHMFNGIIDIAEVERWTGFLDQVIMG